MQNKIYIKSMVIGAALGAVIILSVAAGTTQSSSSGRYQLVISDGYAFKIDSATGKVWKAFMTAPDAAFMAAPVDK